MKRFFASLLLLFFAVAGFAQQEVDNGYVIKNWVYNAVVHPDNSWTVSERLDVEFLEYRHGIYRNIPTVFVKKRVVDGDTLQYTYVSQIRGISVLDEHCELLDAEDEQNSIVMRIGDEYTTLIGPHTYTINYTLRYPDDRWKGCDDIVHTVLGATCNTVVENFDFAIKFDNGLPASVAKDMKVYSGPWGGQDNSLGVLCSVQGDSICARYFEALGVASKFTAAGVRLTRRPVPTGDTRGMTSDAQGLMGGTLMLDFKHCPDLAQTFVVTAALLGRAFHFSGLNSLRIKETDRIAALTTELLKLGYMVYEQPAGHLVYAGEDPLAATSTTIATYSDHRMAMAFAPAAYRFPNLTIEHPEVVSKSYPKFWEDLPLR